MKILFFHGSDLFERTGTATIYRRTLPLLDSGCQLCQPALFWAQAPAGAELAEKYRRELPQVQLELPGFYRATQAYIRFSTWRWGLTRVKPLVALYRSWLRRVLRRSRPDAIWFSSDYLVPTYRLLDALLPELAGIHLHLSIYDPPELWGNAEGISAAWRRVLAAADSFDVIGENMRDRVRAEAGEKPIAILSDYVETLPAPVAQEIRGPEVRGVITGRIYAEAELQRLVDLLGTTGRTVRIDWYGIERDMLMAAKIKWPATVRFERKGLVPRERIAGEIAQASFGFVSMPGHSPSFARYSVPTKLVTYAEAGLPVLFDAPADAELNRLNERFQFGLNLATLPPNASRLHTLLSGGASFRSGVCELASQRFSRPGIVAALRSVTEAMQGAPFATIR